MNNDENIETKHWNNFHIDADFCIERGGHTFGYGRFFRKGLCRRNIFSALYFTFPYCFDIQQQQCYIRPAMQKIFADTFFRIVADFIFSSILLFIICMGISWIRIFGYMLKYKLFDEL